MQLNDRTKHYIGFALLWGVWAFFVWIGDIGIRHHYTEVLTIYVFVAATAVTAMIGWIFTSKKPK